MPRLIFTTVLALSMCCLAQQTRREVAHHSSDPADDTRPNSSTVPDVIALHAQFKRILLLRFKNNTDLLAGINKMVQQEKIRNAIILSGVGSVRNYQIHQVGNREIPPKDIFTKDPSAPADIIGMSGVVIGGRAHAHITLANPEHAFGGHLEPDTAVFTFAVITLGILDDSIDLSKLDDWNYR